MITKFQYRSTEIKTGKKVVPLGRTDLTSVAVQVVAEGGENELHSHPALDGVWFVLSGALLFYDENGLIATVGQGEGMIVPRGEKYWFEKTGDGNAEVLHVAGRDPTRANRRDGGRMAAAAT